MLPPLTSYVCPPTVNIAVLVITLCGVALTLLTFYVLGMHALREWSQKEFRLVNSFLSSFGASLLLFCLGISDCIFPLVVVAVMVQSFSSAFLLWRPVKGRYCSYVLSWCFSILVAVVGPQIDTVAMVATLLSVIEVILVILCIGLFRQTDLTMPTSVALFSAVLLIPTVITLVYFLANKQPMPGMDFVANLSLAFTAWILPMHILIGESLKKKKIATTAHATGDVQSLSDDSITIVESSDVVVV